MRDAGPDDWHTDARWVACGASVTGQEHQRRGLGCDDAFSYGICDDFVVAAVADGAGSVTGTSAWGAYVACQSVLSNAIQPDFLTSYRGCSAEHAERLMSWLFEKALKRVVRKADELGLDVALLSTTLCVGLVDRRQAVFGQIGDGVIAAELGGEIASLLIEQKDEYANTTSFLQSENAFAESFRTSVHPGVTAFALSTDGMAYKITNVATGDAYQPFFRDSWQHVRSGASSEQFAALLRGIEDDQTGDDKTMVLVALKPDGNDNVAVPTALVKDHSPSPNGLVERVEPVDIVANAETVPLGRTPQRRRRFGWGRRHR